MTKPATVPAQKPQQLSQTTDSKPSAQTASSFSELSKLMMRAGM